MELEEDRLKVPLEVMLNLLHILTKIGFVQPIRYRMNFLHRQLGLSTFPEFGFY